MTRLSELLVQAAGALPGLKLDLQLVDDDRIAIGAQWTAPAGNVYDVRLEGAQALGEEVLRHVLRGCAKGPVE